MRPLLLAAATAILVAAADTGARQPDKKTDPKAKVEKKEEESKFNLKIKTDNIRLGKQLTGTKLTPADLKGKVVLLDFWGVNCPPCLAAMPGVAATNAELADFGLVVLGAHAQASTPEIITSVAASRGANFPILEGAGVTGGNDFQTIPHVMVFDHTGACIFRGLPREAEHKARAAVGEMLVANAGRDKFAPALNGAISELKKGQSPTLVLPRIVSQLNGTKDVAADAKALLDAVTAIGQKKYDQAVEKAESNPVEAFLLVEKVPAAYKGTQLAKDATALVTKLKKDKGVTAELAARPALAMVQQFATALAGQPGADKPTAPDFQKANMAILAQLKVKVAQMKKSWPDAKATAEALEIATRYGASP